MPTPKTVGELIAELQKQAKTHGADAPIYLVECYDEPDSYVLTGIYQTPQGIALEIGRD